MATLCMSAWCRGTCVPSGCPKQGFKGRSVLNEAYPFTQALHVERSCPKPGPASVSNMYTALAHAVPELLLPSTYLHWQANDDCTEFAPSKWLSGLEWSAHGSATRREQIARSNQHGSSEMLALGSFLLTVPVQPALSTTQNATDAMPVSH
eukprot:1633960-Amphidinium_carterae.2